MIFFPNIRGKNHSLQNTLISDTANNYLYIKKLTGLFKIKFAFIWQNLMIYNLLYTYTIHFSVLPLSLFHVLYIKIKTINIKTQLYVS